MNRQSLTDGAGWLDLDTAVQFEEDTRWDGHNRISLATGSQWNHESLYRTRSQRWVLHSWSQYMGSAETWSQLSDEDAAEWLVRNGHDHPAAAEAIAAQEM